jgi:alcohol dehydrogenase
MVSARPFDQTRPLTVEDLLLDAPGPGEVLVEMVAAGLCHSDLSTINGDRPRPLPMVLGHEAAGIVREVGSGVASVVPGDHVVCTFVSTCGQCLFCQSGRPALCTVGATANTAATLPSGAKRLRTPAGETINHHLGVSAFAEYAVVGEGSLVKVDPALPLEKAALFGCAVLTGVGAVLNTARAEPGTSVAVFGLGGVGLCAILGARAAGSTPIVAVDVLDSKLEIARSLGASHTVRADAPDAVDQIKSITGGGAHAAVEAVGSARVMAQAYLATRRGGTTVVAGLPHPEQKLELPAVTLAAEERTLKGSYMGSSVPRRDIPRFIAMYQAGLLPVDDLLTRSLPLDEVNHGFEELASGRAVRQVLRFDRAS